MSTENVEIARLQEKLSATNASMAQLQTTVDTLAKRVDSLNAWRSWIFGASAGVGLALGMFGAQIKQLFSGTQQ